jgi:hypothetical protein
MSQHVEWVSAKDVRIGLAGVGTRQKWDGAGLREGCAALLLDGDDLVIVEGTPGELMAAVLDMLGLMQGQDHGPGAVVGLYPGAALLHANIASTDIARVISGLRQVVDGLDADPTVEEGVIPEAADAPVTRP